MELGLVSLLKKTVKNKISQIMDYITSKGSYRFGILELFWNPGIILEFYNTYSRAWKCFGI